MAEVEHVDHNILVFLVEVVVYPLVLENIVKVPNEDLLQALTLFLELCRVVQAQLQVVEVKVHLPVYILD